MDTLSLKGSSKVTFSAITTRYGKPLSWSPGEYANSPATFTKGTGALQCDQVVDYVDLAIAISTTVALNLRDGTVLKDYEGANLALSKLKFYCLMNTGTVPLTFDPTTTNGMVEPVTDAVELRPGNALGPFWHEGAGGWTVDATHKLWNIINASASVAGKLTLVIGGVK